MFGFFLVILQYLQLMLGYSALKAAVALLPMTFVMIPISAGRRAAVGSASGRSWSAASGSGHRRRRLRVPSRRSTRSSGYWPFLLVALVLGVGIGLAMTPATNAIVSSLPAAKQGVASAVNDTTREIGAALRHRHHGQHVQHRLPQQHRHAGSPAAGQVAAAAQQAPAAALQAAGRLGPNGRAWWTTPGAAFMSGQRIALLIGAAALAVGVVFLLAGGAPATVDVLDAIDADSQAPAWSSRPSRVDRDAIRCRLAMFALIFPGQGPSGPGMGRPWVNDPSWALVGRSGRCGTATSGPCSSTPTPRRCGRPATPRSPPSP